MSLTRDQLRAARALLHLQQDVLADMARVGVATIRRFEGGRDIGHLHLEALRNAVVGAGAILIDEGTATSVGGGMTGVLLRPADQLPEDTRARIAAGRVYTRGALPEAPEKATDGTSGGADDHVAASPSGKAADAGRGTRKGRPKGTTRRTPRPAT